MLDPRVRSGHITALRLFDIAYAIDLRRVEEIWVRHAGTASSRSRLSATPAKAVAFGVPPVALSFDPIPLHLGTLAVTAAVTVRIYDFGVVAVALRVPAVDMTWADYTTLLNAMDAHVGDGGDGRLWDGLLARVRTLLAEALVRPTASAIEEDYLIGTVHAFSETLTAAALQDRLDLVPLLSGEGRAAVRRRPARPAAPVLQLLHGRPGGHHLGPRLHLRAPRRQRRGRRAGGRQRPAAGDALLRRAAG